MTTTQNRFDGVPIRAHSQFRISEAGKDIACPYHIRVGRIAAHPTAKRLLVRAIGAGNVMTHGAFLTGVRRIDGGQVDAPFLGPPDQLLRQVP